MLLSCGDALIDFLPGTARGGRSTYVPSVGGSCLNIAVAMGRLGAPAGFVGGLSTDFFGEMIVRHATGSGVNLQFSSRAALGTTLAFVSTLGGEPQYVFYDENTASRSWAHEPGSIDFAQVDAIHFGSTTLVHEDVAGRTLSVLEEAKGLATISFDPNCRPRIVRDKGDYVERMTGFARRSDIVRMSDIDFDYLYGHRDFEAKASELFVAGIALFIVTQGGNNVLAWHRQAGAIEVAQTPIRTKDTVGAGDTFQGALLVALRELGRIRLNALAAISPAQLAEAIAFASRCAGITCQRVGADPPGRADIPAKQWDDLRSSIRQRAPAD